MKKSIATIFFVLTISCNFSPDWNNAFVKKFGNQSFKEFKNTTLFIRSADRAGELIIFAYQDKLKADLNNGA